MKSIPFFSDEIRIRPHTASDARHIGKAISVRDFAAGQPCALYETESGDFLCRVGRYPAQRFIEGAKASRAK